MTDTLVLPSSGEPAVSIVVLATRNGERLRRCLEAVASSCEHALSIQTIVCLNAASRDVDAVVESTSGAIVMRSTVNLGTAATWNRAIDACPAPRFAIVHEDARPRLGWLSALVAALDADSSVAVAGATICGPDHGVQSQGWVHWRNGEIWQIAPDTAPGLAVGDDPYPVDSVSSATMLVDRAHWAAVGGFDERLFPAFWVERDLCAAAWASGRRVVSVPAATSEHDTGAMIDRAGGPFASLAFREFLIRRNHRHFAKEWHQHLDGRPPQPPAHPDLDAVREALRRTAQFEPLPRGVARVHSELRRSLTFGAPPSAMAPPEVEQRAAAAQASLTDEFLVWLCDQWAALRNDHAAEVRHYQELLQAAPSDLVRHRAPLQAAQAPIVDAAAVPGSAADELERTRHELAAIEATLTWRAHTTIVRHPMLRRLARFGAAAIHAWRRGDDQRPVGGTGKIGDTQ